MKVLVTGADGFVGSWVVRELLRAGHAVTGARGGQHATVGARLTPEERAAVEWLPLELTDSADVRRSVDGRWEAIVHLAGIAWSRDAAEDPGRTWNVNAGGTARVLEAAGQARLRDGADPLVIVVSTAEVYGRGPAQPRRESDSIAPLSPYAASKAGAELAAAGCALRYGLRTIVVRPFPHTGPGQRPVFVVPAFIERIRLAVRTGAPAVKTGSLEAVRDFLDVRDVARAYLALLTGAAAGETYNLASGRGQSLEEVFRQIAERLGSRTIAEVDPTLMRPWDVPHLVGDVAKLRAATGWAPQIPFAQTLSDMIDAQTD